MCSHSISNLISLLTILKKNWISKWATMILHIQFENHKFDSSPYIKIKLKLSFFVEVLLLIKILVEHKPCNEKNSWVLLNYLVAHKKNENSKIDLFELR